MKIAKLTTGEKLLIDRRRRGESQGTAARRLGETLYQYRKWEGEKEEPHSRIHCNVGKLEVYETCFLMRRRLGIRASQFAKTLGVCRWWLTQMEQGTVDHSTLVEYWQKNHALAKSIKNK